MNLLLKPEQRALQIVQRRHSEDGQMGLFQRAIARGIDAVQSELMAETAKPSLQAVLSALGNEAAAYLAMIDDPKQRAAMTEGFAVQLAREVERAVLNTTPDSGRG